MPSPTSACLGFTHPDAVQDLTPVQGRLDGGQVGGIHKASARRSGRSEKKRRPWPPPGGEVTRAVTAVAGVPQIEPCLGTLEEVEATDEEGYLVVSADDVEELSHLAD